MVCRSGPSKCLSLCPVAAESQGRVEIVVESATDHDCGMLLRPMATVRLKVGQVHIAVLVLRDRAVLQQICQQGGLNLGAGRRLMGNEVFHLPAAHELDHLRQRGGATERSGGGILMPVILVDATG